MLLIFHLPTYGNVQDEEPKEILIKIEEAFQKGDVNKLANYLTGKTYISLSEGLTGYYSYSQTYNLLKDYFEVYKPLSFNFASIVADNRLPFAWGEYKYLKKGMRDSHKIFVSLQKVESRFTISQITIN